MSLSQLVRRYFVPAALVVGMLGCSSEKDPCRDGRIYQEGIGCVEESNVDSVELIFITVPLALPSFNFTSSLK